MAFLISERSMGLTLRTVGVMRGHRLQISEATRGKRDAAPIFGLLGQGGATGGGREGGNKPHDQDRSAHTIVSQKKDRILTFFCQLTF